MRAGHAAGAGQLAAGPGAAPHAPGVTSLAGRGKIQRSHESAGIAVMDGMKLRLPCANATMSPVSRWHAGVELMHGYISGVTHMRTDGAATLPWCLPLGCFVSLRRCRAGFDRK